MKCSVYAAFQALYETRSIINGEFPTFTCRKGKGEGWANRIGYTWVGITWISILFYFFFLYTYQVGNTILTYVPYFPFTRDTNTNC